MQFLKVFSSLCILDPCPFHSDGNVLRGWDVGQTNTNHATKLPTSASHSRWTRPIIPQPHKCSLIYRQKCTKLSVGVQYMHKQNADSFALCLVIRGSRHPFSSGTHTHGPIEHTDKHTLATLWERVLQFAEGELLPRTPPILIND